MRQLIKYLSSITLFFLIVNFATAQLYIDNKILLDSSQQELYFRFENSYFTRDKEYYSDLTFNSTDIGLFIKPSLEYYLTNNTKVNAGIFALKYSGLDNFSQVIPIFSVQQRLSKNLDLVLGSIYGSSYHNLSEAIFKIDNYYSNNVEYGMQLLFHSKIFYADAWINWEKYIFLGDPYQERFHIGWNSELKFDINSLSISLPLQLYVGHNGGTIDSCLVPAKTIFNGLSGVKIRYNINKKTYLSFEPMIYSYQALKYAKTGLYALAITEGNAFYLNLKLRSKYIDAVIGYWYASNFIAPRGEFLFQSISEKDPSYYQKYRKLIPFKVVFKYPVNKYIKIQLRTDAYYNITDNIIDNAYSLFFIINQDFFVSKIKQRPRNR